MYVFGHFDTEKQLYHTFNRKEGLKVWKNFISDQVTEGGLWP